MEFLTIVDRNTTDHVDIDGIVRDLGINLVKNASLPAGQHGRLAPSAEGEWIMELNRADKELRRRFTTAHMIGHWIMHHEAIGTGLHEATGYEQDIHDEYHNRDITEVEETEANVFAAELLLPAGLVLPIADKETVNYKSAAQTLRCSISGLMVRLEVLEQAPEDHGLEAMIP